MTLLEEFSIHGNKASYHYMCPDGSENELAKIERDKVISIYYKADAAEQACMRMDSMGFAYNFHDDIA